MFPLPLENLLTVLITPCSIPSTPNQFLLAGTGSPHGVMEIFMHLTQFAKPFKDDVVSFCNSRKYMSCASCRWTDLAALSHILSGKHGRVGRGLVAIGLHLHAAGDTRQGLAARQVSDVHELQITAFPPIALNNR